MSFEWSQETPPQRVPTTPELKRFRNVFEPVVPEAFVGFDENGRGNEPSRNGLEEQINRFDHIVDQYSPIEVQGDTFSSLSTPQSFICRISEDSQSQVNQSPIITSCCSIESKKNLEMELRIVETSDRELCTDKPKVCDDIVLSGHSVQKRQITELESKNCCKYFWDDSEPLFNDAGAIFFDSDPIFA